MPVMRNNPLRRRAHSGFVCLYRSPVSPLNLGGYCLAFLAVCIYNARKLREMQKAKDAAAASAPVPVVPETEPLLKQQANNTS